MKFFGCIIALLLSSVTAAPLDATTEKTTKGETPAPFHECIGKKDGTLVKDSSNPSIFHECIGNGMAYSFHCPRGLIFSEETQTCNFDPDHPITVSPPKVLSKYDCSNKKDGFYEDKSDPTKFHECTNGLATDFNCPIGTIFEEKRQVCVYDDDWKSRTHQTVKVATTPTTLKTEGPTSTILSTQKLTTQTTTTQKVETTLPTEQWATQTIIPTTISTTITPKKILATDGTTAIIDVIETQTEKGTTRGRHHDDI